MLNRKQKLILFKLFGLFSTIRVYNVVVILIAQYLTSIFILSPNHTYKEVLLDVTLLLIVISSSLSISSGYIINNFYDSKKDLINRPKKSMLDRLVSQKTKLYVYFSLNFIVSIIALTISWRAFLFFTVYIFLIWFYSHKLKKYAIIGNLASATLSVLPFFAILMHFKNFDEVIFPHAIFLFLILWIREMIKDLENIKGDLANNYKTVPIIYGEENSKKMIAFLTFLTLIPIYILVEFHNIGSMDVYFYLSIILLIFFLIKLYGSKAKEQYLLLHNLLKFILIVGVFSIVLIAF
jgi:4-hydroxybenzoate polyprenyltransferase